MARIPHLLVWLSRVEMLYLLTASSLFAGVAQSVEQLIRNQQVSGSSPLTSSIPAVYMTRTAGFSMKRLHCLRISGLFFASGS